MVLKDIFQHQQLNWPNYVSEAERGRQCIYQGVVFIYSPAVSSVLSFLRILSSPVPFNCNLLMDSFTLPVKTVITALSWMWCSLYSTTATSRVIKKSFSSPETAQCSVVLEKVPSEGS